MADNNAGVTGLFSRIGPTPQQVQALNLYRAEKLAARGDHDGAAAARERARTGGKAGERDERARWNNQRRASGATDADA